MSLTRDPRKNTVIQIWNATRLNYCFKVDNITKEYWKGINLTSLWAK